MCGRFSMAIDSDDLQTALALGNMPKDWRRRYNIAPSQEIAVVSDEMTRDVHYARWGLVPFWAKDPQMGNRLINARSETLIEKPSFKYAFRQRRCLILADGFYEWQKSNGDVKKTNPFYFSSQQGQPLIFAGLWESWSPKDQMTDEKLITTTIITCPANQTVNRIHERMPVILSGEEAWEWLGEENEAFLLSLLRPCPEGILKTWQVSPLVNNPKIDSPDCISPLKSDLTISSHLVHD